MADPIQNPTVDNHNEDFAGQIRPLFADPAVPIKDSVLVPLFVQTADGKELVKQFPNATPAQIRATYVSDTMKRLASNAAGLENFNKFSYEPDMPAWPTGNDTGGPPPASSVAPAANAPPPSAATPGILNKYLPAGVVDAAKAKAVNYLTNTFKGGAGAIELGQDIWNVAQAPFTGDKPIAGKIPLPTSGPYIMAPLVGEKLAPFLGEKAKQAADAIASRSEIEHQRQAAGNKNSTDYVGNSPFLGGFTAGLLDKISELSSSPTSMAIMAASMGGGAELKAVGGLGKLLKFGLWTLTNRATRATFSASMASQLFSEYPELKKAIQNGDTPEAGRDLAKAMVDGAMLYQGGNPLKKHPLMGEAEAKPTAPPPGASKLPATGVVVKAPTSTTPPSGAAAAAPTSGSGPAAPAAAPVESQFPPVTYLTKKGGNRLELPDEAHRKLLQYGVNFSDRPAVKAKNLSDLREMFNWQDLTDEQIGQNAKDFAAFAKGIYNTRGAKAEKLAKNEKGFIKIPPVHDVVTDTPSVMAPVVKTPAPPAVPAKPAAVAPTPTNQAAAPIEAAQGVANAITQDATTGKVVPAKPTPTAPKTEMFGMGKDQFSDFNRIANMYTNGNRVGLAKTDIGKVILAAEKAGKVTPNGRQSLATLYKEYAAAQAQDDAKDTRAFTDAVLKKWSTGPKAAAKPAPVVVAPVVTPVAAPPPVAPPVSGPVTPPIRPTPAPPENPTPAPVAEVAPPALPEPAPMVRMYHGGVGPITEPRWFTSDRKYAEGYAAKSPGAQVHYVDVPADHPLLVPEYPEQSIAKGFHVSTELPRDISMSAQPALPPELETGIARMKVPDYVKDTIRQDVTRAHSLGLVGKIEELSAQRKTAAEALNELGLPQGGTEGNDARRMVRSVRSALGIPSMDQKAEFEGWLANRQKSAAGPASESAPAAAPAQPAPPALPAPAAAPTVEESAPAETPHTMRDQLKAAVNKNILDMLEEGDVEGARAEAGHLTSKLRDPQGSAEQLLNEAVDLKRTEKAERLAAGERMTQGTTYFALKDSATFGVKRGDKVVFMGSKPDGPKDVKFYFKDEDTGDILPSATVPKAQESSFLRLFGEDRVSRDVILGKLGNEPLEIEGDGPVEDAMRFADGILNRKGATGAYPAEVTIVDHKGKPVYRNTIEKPSDLAALQKDAAFEAAYTSENTNKMTIKPASSAIGTGTRIINDKPPAGPPSAAPGKGVVQPKTSSTGAAEGSQVVKAAGEGKFKATPAPPAGGEYLVPGQQYSTKDGETVIFKGKNKNGKLSFTDESGSVTNYDKMSEREIREEFSPVGSPEHVAGAAKAIVSAVTNAIVQDAVQKKPWKKPE